MAINPDGDIKTRMAINAWVKTRGIVARLFVALVVDDRLSIWAQGRIVGESAGTAELLADSASHFTSKIKAV